MGVLCVWEAVIPAVTELPLSLNDADSDQDSRIESVEGAGTVLGVGIKT